MTRSPRVLHVTTTAVSLDWLLGPQLHAFRDAGFDVMTASAGGPHVASLLQQGIPHYELPSLSRNIDPLADARSIGELRKLVQRLEPDILHTHNPKPGVLGRIVGRVSGVPIIVNTVHGLYAQPEDSSLRRLVVYGAERAAASFSHAELVQNVEDVATLRSLRTPNERLHLLGNGVDLSRFSPSQASMLAAERLRQELGIDRTTPVVGMVGRLVWEKGYREFFEAVRSLHGSRKRSLAIVVVGPDEAGKDGAVDSAALDEMEQLGVRFLGSRSDIEVVLSLFDIFVLPSYREGFPRSAMEASAMGVPIVATDIRGCRQVVDHSRTGLLVAPRDSAALAEAIAYLLDQPLLRASMGAAAARRATADFDQERVIARTVSVYRKLLKDAGIEGPQATLSRYSDSIDLVDVAASNREDEILAA
jgi:glycosyltransferase involved in cell wall biosynthesis